MRAPSSHTAEPVDILQEKSFRKLLHRVTIGPIVVLSAALITVLCLALLLAHAGQQIDRLDSKLSHVLAIQKLVLDMETGVRGYVHTRDQQFLEPWREANVQVDSELERLTRVFEDDPEKAAVATQLRGAVDQWRHWAAGALAIPPFAEAPNSAFGYKGKALMDRVRERFFQLVALIESERTERASAFDKMKAPVVTAAILASVLIALGSAAWLRRQLQRMNRAYGTGIAAATGQIEELNILLNAIGDAVAATDANGKVVFLNPVAERLTGWNSREAKGTPIREVFIARPNTLGEAKDDLLERVMKEGRQASREAILHSRDGTQIPIEERVSPIHTPSGHLRGLIIVFHDATEKRERERRIVESERRFRSVFNQQFQFMAILSPEGRILEINDLPLQVSGVTREDVIHRLFWETPWWEGLPEMQAAWPGRLAAAPLSEEPVVTEIQYRAANGEVRFADASVTAMKNDQGQVEMLLVQASDTTDRKRAAAALRENSERLQFLNDLSDTTRSLSDPTAVMVAVSRLLGQKMNASRCAYADVEADGDHFTIFGDYTNGCESSVGHYSLSRFGSRAVAAMAEGRTLVIRDIPNELAPEDGAEMFGSIGIKAVICCPLVKAGRLRAMMAVHQLEPRAWTNAEIALVEEVVERSWSYIERVRAGDALRENEERLRLATRATMDAIWDRDLSTGKILWNEAICTLSGYSSSEIIPNAEW